MKITYNEKKATEAACRLLSHAGGSMDKIRLIKLLYLADRASLVRWGRPITFDQYYSLPHGPIVSNTLDRINEPGPPDSKSYWLDNISELDGNKISLLGKEYPRSNLSDADESIIDAIFSQFSNYDVGALIDYTHNLPEYEDPEGGRLPIRLYSILSAEGFELDDIKHIQYSLHYQSQVTTQN